MELEEFIETKTISNPEIYLLLKAFRIWSSGQRDTESELSFLQDGSVSFSYLLHRNQISYSEWGFADPKCFFLGMLSLDCKPSATPNAIWLYKLKLLLEVEENWENCMVAPRSRRLLYFSKPHNCFFVHKLDLHNTQLHSLCDGLGFLRFRLRFQHNHFQHGRISVQIIPNQHHLYLLF